MVYVYFSILLAILYGTPNDFLNLIRLGFLPVVIIFFILSTLLWFPKNKGLVLFYVKKYKQTSE